MAAPQSTNGIAMNGAVPVDAAATVNRPSTSAATTGVVTAEDVFTFMMESGMVELAQRFQQQYLDTLKQETLAGTNGTPKKEEGENNAGGGAGPAALKPNPAAQETAAAPSVGPKTLAAPPPPTASTLASPTPTKPVEPSPRSLPPLDKHESCPALPDAEEDALEVWDAREPGVRSGAAPPKSEEDVWHLNEYCLAPRFPFGGGLTYAQHMRAAASIPEPEMVKTRPYQKRPPPKHLPLESFDLRVIYEAGRTGFEDNKDFPIEVGSVIAGRYQVSEYLGSAAFSRAIQCIDLKHEAQVCVKIIRNSKDFFDQSLDEIKLLLHVNSSGSADENNVLQLYDYFYYKEHMFLVCELLRDNLYEFAKFNREHERELYFTLPRVRLVAKQVLEALAFIHNLGLLHCDLKPENILIKSYSRCIVKVIDFGSSCYKTDSLSSYVQSRCYRAPEVVLGCEYDGRIDVWSLGAILPELMTGHVLFLNDTLAQMLARISAICGPFPESMLHSGRHTSCFVNRYGVFYEYPSQGLEKTEGPLTLHYPRRTSLERLAGSDDPDYLDFLKRCLTIDPRKRATPAELLQHPFILAAGPAAQGGPASPRPAAKAAAGAPASPQ